MTQTATKAPCQRGLDAAPAIAWIRQTLREKPGAHPNDFADAAGVSRRTIGNLLGPSPRPRLYSGTYQQIMATTAADLRVPRRRVLPGEPARRIVESLGRDGWTVQEIAAAGGLHPSTLYRSRLDHVYAETFVRLVYAQRVLTKRRALGRVSPPKSVPACGVLRRVEALLALGWTRRELEEFSGLSLNVLRTRRATVSYASAQRVRAVFEALRMTPGGNAGVRVRARRWGYAPWSAWTPETIDDPGAVPEWGFVSDPVWREAIRARYSSQLPRD